MAALPSPSHGLFGSDDPAWDLTPPRPIQRLWLAGSLTDAKEKTVRRLLTDSVLLSLDDGTRLVGPNDHLLIFDTRSRDGILLGPGPACLESPAGLAEQLATPFLGGARLRSQVTPVLALSFRGGLPAARLAGERTTVTSALRHTTDRLSHVGPARASGMALNTLDAMDDALVGVFHRERAAARTLSGGTSVAYCEKARDAFERAGLPRPRRSSENEVRRLWSLRQSVFPFTEEPAAQLRARRLGWAADVLLGACLELAAWNAPPGLSGFLPRRIQGTLDLDLLATFMPEADPLEDVLVPVFRVDTTPPYRVGQSIRLAIILESQLTAVLRPDLGERPRGPSCLASLSAGGGDVDRPPGAARIGDWWPCTVTPTRAGALQLKATFVVPGLDSVTISHRLEVTPL